MFLNSILGRFVLGVEVSEGKEGPVQKKITSIIAHINHELEAVAEWMEKVPE